MSGGLLVGDQLLSVSGETVDHEGVAEEVE